MRVRSRFASQVVRLLFSASYLLSLSHAYKQKTAPLRLLCVYLGIPTSPGEFSTPVGGLIEQATSESLVNTDWALNLQICDEVSTQCFT